MSLLPVSRHGRPDQFRDRVHAAVGTRSRRFDDKTDGAHAQNHAVTPFIKRERRFLDLVVRGGRASGNKPAANPR